MNYDQAKEIIRTEFVPLIAERFKEVYGPDVFKHQHCRDKETYNNTNGNMYTHYLMIANSLERMPECPKYKRCFDESRGEYDYILDMYKDFKETSDPLKWLIEFIPARYHSI